MKKKPELLTKCLSGLASLTLIFASMPAMPVLAEESIDGVEQSEESMIPEETEDITSVSSVYVINDFRDFHKTEEGKFQNEEIQNKYGDFKVLPGTSMEQLALPDKLVLDGYWEADGAVETLELKEIDWKLKSDSGEVYSEASPEGSYTFVPDLDAYLLTDESIDEFLLADETVKLPEISLTVAAQPESEEVETQGSNDVIGIEDSAEPDILADVPTDDDVIDIPADDDVIDIPADGQTDAVLDEEENIFDGLDDSILEDGGSGDVVVYDGTAETETVDPEALSDDAPVTPVGDDNEPTEATESTEVAAPTVATAEVTFKITDSNGTVLYDYSGANNNSSITLTADIVGEVPTISGLYCGADLSALRISFTNTATGSSFAAAEIVDGTAVSADSWNFSDGAGKTFQLTEYIDGVETANKYTVKFAGITQDSHTSAGNATCIQNATCAACGISIPNTMIAHQFSPATCTEPEKCINCGTIGAPAKGHNWIEATCTAARTCSVCGAVEGEPLGHDWSAATCTTPKTCKRCGATEGKALGHDMNNDWETVEASTDTVHGKQIRYCSRDCGYYEERALNIIGNPDNNTILNLAEGGQYNLNTKITFSASGAAMGNADPFDGDVRYVPLSWSIQGTPGTFMDNFTGAFSITKAGTYTVTVVFQKQIYENGSWKSTDIADSKSVTFTVGNLVQGNLVGTSDGIRINPQTGDSTPIIPLAIALVAALAAIIGVVIFKKKK